MLVNAIKANLDNILEHVIIHGVINFDDVTRGGKDFDRTLIRSLAGVKKDEESLQTIFLHFSSEYYVFVIFIVFLEDYSVHAIIACTKWFWLGSKILGNYQ